MLRRSFLLFSCGLAGSHVASGAPAASQDQASGSSASASAQTGGAHLTGSHPSGPQRTDMMAAWAAGRPIVIMFSTPGCPYCHALRTEHLEELQARQQSVGVLYLELDLSDRRPFGVPNAGPVPPLLDGVVDGRDLARRLGVRFAPTVVFLGPEGELAERLIGYGARDFYAAYLDQRIVEARRRLAARS